MQIHVESKRGAQPCSEHGHKSGVRSESPAQDTRQEYESQDRIESGSEADHSHVRRGIAVRGCARDPRNKVPGQKEGSPEQPAPDALAVSGPARLSVQSDFLELPRPGIVLELVGEVEIMVQAKRAAIGVVPCAVVAVDPRFPQEWKQEGGKQKNSKRDGEPAGTKRNLGLRIADCGLGISNFGFRMGNFGWEIGH